VVDGARFQDFAGFCMEFSRSVLLGEYDWGGNLDALNDVLRGGFGTPDGPWVLKWIHANQSRQALGFEAMIRWLRDHLATCHPSSQADFRARLAKAERQQGETLFDLVVSIMREHGVGGSEPEDEVVLVIED
jgi:RNAse (barnase) inhibitor barstar